MRMDMDKIESDFIRAAMSDLPKNLRGRVAVIGGVLHVSEEQRGSMELDNLVAKLRRQNVLKLEWHKPDEFGRLFTQAYGDVSRDDNEIKKYAVELIARAHLEEASDIHITWYGPYAHVDFRIMGMLKHYETLHGDMVFRVIACIYQTLGTQTGATFTAGLRQDGRIANRDFLPDGVFSVRIHTEPIQCASAPDGQGVFMALRLLFDGAHARGSLESRLTALGFTPDQIAIVASMTERTGLNIISGPTGHGKTTFLSNVMVAMAEKWPERNHMSMEDPPEYPLDGVKQIMVSAVEILTDEERDAAYTAAIAGALRSDMDTGMVGEIRYRSAAQAAINAALTGHAIWTTVHATNALAIIPRFVEMGINLKSLCNPNVLSGLSYQRLIPKLCPECKRPLRENISTLPQPTFRRLTRLLDPAALDGVYVRGNGCDACRHRGVIGQTVAAEVIAMDWQLLQYLREDQAGQAYTYWLNDMHGLTHVAHALKLISEGMVDPYNAEERLGVNLDFDSTNNLRAS